MNLEPQEPTTEERVQALVAAFSRALGEMLQDNPSSRPMVVACAIMDGESFASVIGGGAHIDAPAFDRALTLLAGDLCESRGGAEYTSIYGYKNADEAAAAKPTDQVPYKGEREKNPAWPFPTGKGG